MALKIHKETMLLKKQFSRQSVGDNYDEVELCGVQVLCTEGPRADK